MVHSLYRRHRADVESTLAEALHELTWRLGDPVGTVGVTGSAGIGVAELLGPSVRAGGDRHHARRAREYPEADAIIELGGEDAKVVYLTGGLEQRMNATCAGGTGGFIDTMAFMLGTSSRNMSSLALGANRIYPIASRCAVFAQTDVRPLLNAGARTSDLAASALEAVVRQTLGELACGRPIEGTVVFLGGPLEHIPELVKRFRSALGLSLRDGIKPPDAHLFAARGAALHGAEAFGDRDGADVSLVVLEERLSCLPAVADDLPRLPRLFATEGDLAGFRERHAAARWSARGCSTARARSTSGWTPDPRPSSWPCSTRRGASPIPTTIPPRRRAENGDRHAGRPVRGPAARRGRGALRLRGPRHRAGTARTSCAQAWASIPEWWKRSRTCARRSSFSPDLTFLLDIGGQDMKAIWVRDGRVVNAVLNEACSSGCGSFIEGTAHSLRSTP